MLDRLDESYAAYAPKSGGACESVFGKGMVAFAPEALNWVAPDDHEEILNTAFWGCTMTRVPANQAILNMTVGEMINGALSSRPVVIASSDSRRTRATR